MQQLLEEAFHSYQVYLQYSGVLDIHQAKLSLLLWPDIAHSAIKMIDNPNSKSELALLQKNLKICVVEPIRIIHDSVQERIKQITGKSPAKSEEISLKAKEVKYEDPLKAKNMLVESINQMFVTLNTITNVEYPALNSKVSHG